MSVNHREFAISSCAAGLLNGNVSDGLLYKKNPTKCEAVVQASYAHSGFLLLTQDRLCQEDVIPRKVKANVTSLPNGFIMNPIECSH